MSRDTGRTGSWGTSAGAGAQSVSRGAARVVLRGDGPRSPAESVPKTDAEGRAVEPAPQARGLGYLCLHRQQTNPLQQRRNSISPTYGKYETF